MTPVKKYLETIGTYLQKTRCTLQDFRPEIRKTLEKEKAARLFLLKEGLHIEKAVELSLLLKRCGILHRSFSYSTVWRIEAGQGGSVDALFAYAWLLGRENTLFPRPNTEDAHPHDEDPLAKALESALFTTR